MGDLAIRVAEMGIDDMDSLRAMDLTTFQEHGLDHLSTRRIWECLHGPDILVIHESETVTSRPDLPVVHARGRGSMKRALDRTITNDEGQLIIDLENDMYAQSSKKPREALWKTWCVMASAWNLYRFPCSPCMPGGWFLSLEKSTHGGPAVIRMIRSSVPWGACRIISLSWVSGQDGYISVLYGLEVVL